MLPGDQHYIRGEGKQSNRDYDRYFTVRGSDRMVCFFDGDDANGNNRYRSSGYSLDPLALSGWHHFSVIGEGSQTRFFVDGVFVGVSDRREQSDVYYIGNSSDNEAFAEFLDDIRIYNVSLLNSEIAQIFGGGFGDMFTSVKIEENSTVDSNPRLLEVAFGQDGQSRPISGFSAKYAELSAGEIIEANASGDNSTYLISVSPDSNNTHYSISIPSVPVKFDSLSLWLDANDSGLDIAPFSLWVDANDTSTITTVNGTNDLISWTNKVDPKVKLHSGTHKPKTGANINGINAINFDYSPNKEQLIARKNGTIDWNPAGVNGLTNGKLSDIAVFMTLQMDTLGRTGMPFNFGWGDHFPWNNGHIYWHFSDNRKSVNLFSAGTPIVVCLYFSVSEQTQVVYKNGSSVLTGPRTSSTNISGAFIFPHTNWEPDYTVGEIIVRNGTLPNAERQSIEGYLAHKWGLASALPGDHLFKSSSVNNLVTGFWRDKSPSLNHSVKVGSPVLLNNSQNGMPVMSYSGATSESHSFKMIEDIRTVFWVLSEDASVPNSDFRPLLGDTANEPDWLANADGNIWGTALGNSHVYNGNTRLNGSIVDGKVTAKPNNLSIISLRTLGNVQSDSFSNDRNIAGRSWHGKLAELLIYNEALSDNEIEKVEGYLAHKWGLEADLPGNHPYKAGPLVSIGEHFTFDANLSIENFRYDFFSNERVYKEDELLSRWRFEEAGMLDSEQLVRDVALGRNHGFLEGDAQLGVGRFGNGLVLDGNGDYFEVPSFRGLFQDANFTLSAWIYNDSIGVDNDLQDAAIFSTNGNDLNTLLLWYDVNSVGTANRSFSFNLGSTAVSLNRINAPDSLAVQNSWQHVVMVVNGDQHILYIDGEEVVMTDFAGTNQAHIEGGSLRLGSWDNSANHYFSGVLDEVRIYQSALNVNDVAVLYGNGIGDLGVVPRISVDANNSSPSIQAGVEFYQFGQMVSVSNFDLSDIQVIGGVASGLNPVGNAYTFTITPTKHPSRINISLLAGAADKGTVGSTAVSQTFSHHPSLTESDALALWYAFEDNNGSTIQDFSGNLIDGALVGGSLTPGKFGQALTLSPNDYVQADAEPISLSTSFTLSLWAKILNDAQGILIRSGQFSLKYHDDSTIRGSIYTGNSWSEVKTISTSGKWIHYVMSYDGISLKLYLDGSLKSSLSTTGYLTWGDGSDHNLYLGRYGTSNWEANVELDDLRIYRKALSAEAIHDLYGSGTGDMGIRPLVIGESPFIARPTPQTVLFMEANQSGYISGLLEAELNASGATFSSYSDNANVSYTYELNASSTPSLVRVEIPYGAVARDGNLSQAGAFEFHNRIVTSVEDGLLAWYDLDNMSQMIAYDRSGQMRNATYVSDDATTPGGGNVTASSSHGTYGRAKAFDNDSTTSNGRWLALQSAFPEANGLFIKYDFGEPVTIGGYRIVNQHHEVESRSPKSWQLFGSEDDSNWSAVLDTVSNQIGWSKWEARNFIVSAPDAYQYYKFVFTEATGENTYLGIAEIDLFPSFKQSQGIFAKALDLNGEFLNLPFRIDQSSTTKGISFSAWVNPRQVKGGFDNERIIFSTDDGGWDWTMSIRYGSLTSWTGATRIQSPLQVYPDEWAHVVSVFDPTQSRTTMYLNGESTTLNSLGFDDSSALLQIGKEVNGRKFNGLIDDIRIWSRPLSSSEVNKVWGGGMGDLGPRVDLQVENPTYGSRINVTATFNQAIADFNASADIDFPGLTLISSTSESESNVSSYDLVFEPNILSEGNFTLKLTENSVTDLYGMKNTEFLKDIDFRPHRIKESELSLWWALDEGTGDKAYDSSTDFDPLWTPASLVQEPLIWLDASDSASIIKTGTTVTEWRDKSNNLNHLTPLRFL